MDNYTFNLLITSFVFRRACEMSNRINGGFDGYYEIATDLMKRVDFENKYSNDVITSATIYKAVADIERAVMEVER